MKKNYAIFVALFLSQITLVSAFSRIELTEEEKKWLRDNPVLTIALDNGNPPMNFQHSDGSYKGISVAYNNLIAEILGVELVLKGGTWDEGLQAAMNHEVDGIMSASEKEERKRALSFTKPYCEVPLAFMTNKKFERIDEIGDLNGKTIAVVRGTVRIPIIEKYCPESDLLLVNSALDGARVISENKAEAFFDDLPVIQHSIESQMLSNLKVSLLYFYPDAGKQRFGLRNDAPHLVTLFNKAIDAISVEEHRRIRNTWLSAGNGVAIQRVIPLLDSEKKWLQEHPVVRVAVDPDYEPVEYRTKNGNYQGIAIEYLRAVEKMIGIRFEIIEDKTALELLDMGRKKKVDMFSCMTPTPERKKYLLFSDVYLSFPVMFYTHKDAPHSKTLHGIRNKKVAVVKGYALQEMLEQAYSDLTIQPVSSIQEGLHLVDTRKVTAFVGNLLTANQYIRRYNMQNVRVGGETEFKNDLTMAVRDDWAPFLDIINKALQNISAEEEKEFYDQWVTSPTINTFNYRYIWQILGVFIALICGILLWNRRLSRAVAARSKELLKVQRMLEAAIEASPAGIIIADAPDVTIRVANKAALDIREGTAAELTNISVETHTKQWQTFYPDGSPVSPENLPLSRAVLTGEIIANEELVIIDKYGKKRWISANAAPVKDAAGKIVAGVAIFPEVTEKRNIEESLRKSEEQYRRLVETSQDLIWSVDSQGRWTYLNEHAAKSIYGFSAKDMLGKHFIDFLPPEQVELDKNMFEKILSGKAIVQYETRHVRKDGAIIDMSFNAAPVYDDQNRLIGIAGTAADITKRKNAENEQHKLEQQLRHVQKLESIGTLAGGIAHDFNNILGGIIGYTDIMIDELGTCISEGNYLPEILAAAERAKELVQQILTFSRQGEEVERKPVELKVILKEVLKLLRATIPSTIDIQQDITTESATI